MHRHKEFLEGGLYKTSSDRGGCWVDYATVFYWYQDAPGGYRHAPLDPPKNGALSCCARTVHLFPGPELSNRVAEILALGKALPPLLLSYVLSLFVQVLLHPELDDFLHQIEWDRLIERESDRPL